MDRLDCHTNALVRPLITSFTPLDTPNNLTDAKFSAIAHWILLRQEIYQMNEYLFIMLNWVALEAQIICFMIILIPLD